jgi:hypothetical protein
MPSCGLIFELISFAKIAFAKTAGDFSYFGFGKTAILAMRMHSNARLH